MTDILRIRNIAFKVFNKTASLDEIVFLKQYLETTDQSTVESILFDLAIADPVQPMRLTGKEKSVMLSAILGEGQKQAPSIGRYRRRAWIPAASLLLVMSGYGVFQLSSRNIKDSGRYRITKTAFGEQKNLVLPDGTRVALNAGSEISYPDKFTDTIRQVYIKGEAFLDVARKPGHPFMVKTAHLLTLVLGTSFNVRDFEGETGAQVQVKTGKVQVALNSQAGMNGQREVNVQGVKGTAPVMLEASQEADYVSGAPVGLRLRQVALEEIAGWTDHKLFFNDKNIREILLELERIYNVRFSAGADSTFLKRYTFHIDKMNLDSTLETISLLADVHFEKKESSIQVK